MLNTKFIKIFIMLNAKELCIKIMHYTPKNYQRIYHMEHKIKEIVERIYISKFPYHILLRFTWWYLLTKLNTICTKLLSDITDAFINDICVCVCIRAGKWIIGIVIIIKEKYTTLLCFHNYSKTDAYKHKFWFSH